MTHGSGLVLYVPLLVAAGWLRRVPCFDLAAYVSYLFQDTWNILDTITIFTILVTFVTRILGLGGDWSSSEDDDSGDNEVFLSARGSFFVSRFLLASIAPMLLSRLLFLYQIDATLGPMVQVNRAAGSGLREGYRWTLCSQRSRRRVTVLLSVERFRSRGWRCSTRQKRSRETVLHDSKYCTWL